MNKLKQILKSKKGFTLMEVIIVVIILAILAAALIPTFLGFIDQARSATAIADARLGMTAAQAAVIEILAREPDAITNGTSGSLRNATTATTTILAHQTFIDAITTDMTSAAINRFSDITVDSGTRRISTIQYHTVGAVADRTTWLVRISIANGTQTAQGADPTPGWWTD